MNDKQVMLLLALAMMVLPTAALVLSVMDILLVPVFVFGLIIYACGATLIVMLVTEKE